MDPPYTPYEDLPERLRKAMQKLQHYKNIVNSQVRRVVDVAVAEWQEADRRGSASAAKAAREEQWAEDRATCIASIRKRKTASITNERAADWASFVAEGSEHAADLLPVPERPAGWLPIPRRPPPSITGDTPVSRGL